MAQQEYGQKAAPTPVNPPHPDAAYKAIADAALDLSAAATDYINARAKWHEALEKMSMAERDLAIAREAFNL